MQIFNTGVELHLTPTSPFSLPPNPEPAALPPPSDTGTWRSPFPIDPTFYNSVLDVKVPITFALTYYVFVMLWNQVNRRRKNKPWPVSKTNAFYLFTIVHNIFLILFSAAAFVAMARAVYVSTPYWSGQKGLAAQVDALCKMNGPRGWGDAVTYDVAAAKFQTRNALIHLDPTNSVPESTDVGRIWNEGLSFWGWTFYLSKFYEVIDTIIILAKGKRATTLQTFHHFGAIFCMWSGMRYMSAPIWMFVIVNSFIHTIMYTFFTLIVLGIKIPRTLKRTLTTMQITQFLWGVVYASIHLFVSYQIPVSTPHKIASIFSDPDAASELLSEATQAARSSGQLPAWVKRLAYRAAGAEALAESVRDNSIYTDRQAALHGQSSNRSDSPFQSPATPGVHYETIPCIDTTGQSFAIWLNCLYLLPLTVLFARFFVKSYIIGEKAGQRPPTPEGKPKQRTMSESLIQAARRTSDAVEKLGMQAEEAVDDAAEETRVNAETVGVQEGDAQKEESPDDATEVKNEGGDEGKGVEDADVESSQTWTEDMAQSLNEKTKKLKDSSLGDSYVQVIEKMKEGATQAAGTGETGKKDEKEEAGNGQEPSATNGNEKAQRPQMPGQTMSTSNTSPLTMGSGDETNGNGPTESNGDRSLDDVEEEQGGEAKSGTEQSAEGEEIRENNEKQEQQEETKDGSMGFGLNG